MGFSVFVEGLNLRLRRRAPEAPVELRPTWLKQAQASGAVGHFAPGRKD
jgi:hypothetical protein